MHHFLILCLCSVLNAADSDPVASATKKTETEIVLNERDYPAHFEKADPLGDECCGLYAAGIIPTAAQLVFDRHCTDPQNKGLAPDELIKIAQVFERAITIWVDPRYQKQFYDPQYIHAVPGQHMTHIYFGPSEGQHPHFQLLIDPTAPNAKAELARGAYMQQVKHLSGLSKFEKTQLMIMSPEQWVCGLPAEASSGALPEEAVNVKKEHETEASGTSVLSSHASGTESSARTEGKQAVVEDDVLDITPHAAVAPEPIDNVSIERARTLLHKDQPSESRVQGITMFEELLKSGQGYKELKVMFSATMDKAKSDSEVHNKQLEYHPDQSKEVLRLLEEYNPLIYKPPFQG